MQRESNCPGRWAGIERIVPEQMWLQMIWFMDKNIPSIFNKKLNRLRETHGADGYEIFWRCFAMILEKMQSGGREFAIDADYDIDPIISESGLPRAEIEDLIIDFRRLGLFDDAVGFLAIMLMIKNG